MRYFVLSIAVLAAAGCSGGSGGTGATSGGTTGNLTAACATYAASLCGFEGQCEPETLVVDYGSISGCETQETALCLKNSAAAGSGETASWVAACGAFYASEASACAAGSVPVAIPAPGDACAVVGALASGTDCGVNAQCQSDSCSRLGTLCGICTKVASAGDACGGQTGASCARGLTCGANGLCLTVVGADAGCDSSATTSCVAGTDCVVASKTATQGACLVSGAKAGAACNPNGIGQPRCWGAAGFYCNPDDQCAAYLFVDGGACGEVKDAGLPGGAEDSVCIDAVCVGNACRAEGLAGNACTYEQDPGCISGVICVTSDAVDGGAGTCQSASPSCAPGTTTGTTGGGTTGGSATGGTSGGGNGGAAGLWINANLSFDSTALSASGTPPDSINCGLTAATGSAFDSQGNLCAAPGLSVINVWTTTELQAGCNPGASITLTYDPTNNFTFTAIAFDGAGNLWGVGSNQTTALPAIWGFKASDLSSTGNLTPTWVGNGTQTPGNDALYEYAPPAMAFDSAGSLWVVNSQSVVAFKASTLAGWSATGSSAVADQQVTNTAAEKYLAKPDSVEAPENVYASLAFDASGDLWIAVNYEPSDSHAPNRGQIIELTPAQLGALSTDDTPTPNFTITWPNSASQGGYGPLAFDTSGDLWAAYYDGTSSTGNLCRYPAANIGSGGSGALDVTINWVEGAGTAIATTLAFNPIPAGLPIQP